MWNRIKTLIVKELQILLRDRKTRIIIIVPPIMQLVVFSFASTLEVKNISMGVYNRDSGEASRQLVRRFEFSPSFIKLTSLDNPRSLKPVLDAQKGVMVLSIPDDFSRKLAAGEPVKVQLLFDGRRSNVAQIVNGYANRILASFRADTGQAAELQPLLVRNWYNPNLDYMYFTLPCLIGILCMVMGITIPALSVAREREFGTFDQILVSPLSSTEILIGKTVPSLLIGLVQATGMILAAVWCFRLPFTGNGGLLYLSIVIFITSVTGIGLFISALCKTQQQAILGAFAFTVPAVMISGYATPVENMPQWLQYLSLLDPLRYFLVIIRGIFLKAMPFGVALENLLPLVALTVVSLLFAGWFFKKKLD